RRNPPAPRRVPPPSSSSRRAGSPGRSRGSTGNRRQRSRWPAPPGCPLPAWGGTGPPGPAASAPRSLLRFPVNLHGETEVLPHLALLAGRAQQVGRVVGYHQRHARVRVFITLPAHAPDGSFHPEQV